MAPMSLISLVGRVETFFTSVLSNLVNSEKIVAVEIVGMLVCFGAVALTTATEREKEEDETL